MSASEELTALAGQVAERGESWRWFGLALVGVGCPGTAARRVEGGE